ncbi:O-linked N-acetylglucosamine transferase, SPINDLY family protein [Paramagnetospirillum marisnigri]|uniref:O-linked N-acetylglucosamine transferase, SPINDLY family protein n=1 Tax=Paramagnetospirillum marisnigri TaxID=1285242 RepID=UPI001FE1DBA4|nr:O-linked N-acetylglucosamine transferase [Paramagnetospirillum marisnigri]
MFSTAIDRAVGRNLSVLDLIQAAEAIRLSDGASFVATLYEAWVRHNPDNPLLYAVLFNFGVVQMDAGELGPARDSLERAIALNPDFYPAYVNLGRVHERLGSAAAAVTQWSAMVDRLAGVTGSAISHKTTALNQMGRVLEAGNQDEAAESMLRQSLDLEPVQREVIQHFLALRQRQCEWPVVQPWDRVSRSVLMEGMSPLSMAAYADDPLLHLAAAWNYNRLDVGLPVAEPPMLDQARAARGERLRIGYLSSDLREHAVGHLTVELFEEHDKAKVELFAYYCGIPSDDPLNRRIKARFDHWIDISAMGDAEAAARMAADGIQILVDLNGYTRDGRTKLIALRPAPVIVNWLGFPGTMGSPYHHYIIADDWIIPEESEGYYSEKVLRLPCYQPNDRKRVIAPNRPARADAGLPEDAVVYCCFNGLHKLTRFTVERWLDILAQVPGSVLWLLSGAEGAQAHLREQAAARGLDPARLVFADKLANPYHLARYPLADLFLDTFPYGAHTTASDALWMGVPVLTLSGRSFAARVCGSLVRSAGLDDLVCETPGDYVSRAVALGRDPAALAALRQRLEMNRGNCVLFDTTLLARKLEELFQAMWRDHQAGRLPQPDLANLDAYLEVGIFADYDQMDGTGITDYPGWWTERLAARHRFRPLPPDRRLWRDG